MNLRHTNTTTGVTTTSKVMTPNNIVPSDSIKQFSGWTYFTNPPTGASLSSYVQQKAKSGGVWTNWTSVAANDGSDNPELENRVHITGAPCAMLGMDSSIDLLKFATNNGTGVINVNALGTAGTALWLRLFEYDPSGPYGDVPIDDPTTPLVNESIEFLKAHGTWVAETLILGPFEFGYDGSCPLEIPFTLKSGDITKLYFANDGVALTDPFTITCPADIVVNCPNAVKFPLPTSTSGCGTINGTYSLPETYAFPINQTTPVTITATDGSGATATCTFNVTVVDTNPPVAPVLSDYHAQCSATPPTPTATDGCSGVINGVSDTPFPITKQGTTVVTWTFDDGHGNKTNVTQNVIVADTIAPVSPPLTDLTFATCSGVGATPPTPVAIDNCKGQVRGTTKTTFPITTLGTNVVTWTFDDGNGNVTQTNQNIILNGFTFQGFYSPIAGIGGTCATPVRTINTGSKNPIKFDILCGTNYITSGPGPEVKVELYSPNCSGPSAVPVDVQAIYLNNWHINWDTTGATPGIYKVTVFLTDGTRPFVFVKLK